MPSRFTHAGATLRKFASSGCAQLMIVLTGVALLSVAVGCGTSEQAAGQRYIPPEADARRALETVLDEWKSGRPPVTKDSRSEVLFVDAQYQNGAKLEDYRVVGPQPWDRGRRFVVEIRLAGSDRPLKVRFVVVGIAPLLVFRQDDFDMLNNWMHPMNAADAQPQSPAQPKLPTDAATESPTSGSPAETTPTGPTADAATGPSGQTTTPSRNPTDTPQGQEGP